ncbi:hypothetical protein MP228_002317 [Amoeboaphelidium protococcarum]|nr:hypothetical protein MP228_002317 [Amoeboaphelidium protococcarum]
MSSLVINMATIIGLPWIISKAFSLMKGRGGDKPQVDLQSEKARKLFAIERLVSVVLVIYAVYYMLMTALYPMPSIFRSLRVSHNAPNYQVRNAYIDYMATLRSDPAAANLTRDSKYNYIRPLTKARLLQYDTTQALGQTQSYDQFITSLYELVKSKELKQYYTRYGHDTFIKCTWCQGLYDYGAVYSSHTLYEYVHFIVFIALVLVSENAFVAWKHGTSSRRGGMFVFCCGIVLSVLCADIAQSFMSQEYFNEILDLYAMSFGFLDDDSMTLSLMTHDYIVIMRRSAFALVLLILVYSPLRPLQDGEKLHALLMRQINCLQLTRLTELRLQTLKRDERLMSEFASQSGATAQKSSHLPNEEEEIASLLSKDGNKASNTSPRMNLRKR